MSPLGRQTRLAMWSGPRNISTAMMRSWENRADCQVVDEPFYAAYLQDTGLDHPMREEILQHQDTDWQQVVKQCLATTANGESVFYQKQMSHHILPHYGRDWLMHVDHCLLLRDPYLVLKSYTKKREHVELADIGLVQQLELYEWLCENKNKAPLIIDSADFLQKPEAYLRAICADIGIEFDQNMLHWPAGQRDSDGVWASHWYNQVWQSTHFKAPTPADEAVNESRSRALPKPLQDVLNKAQPLYKQLHQHRLVL